MEGRCSECNNHNVALHHYHKNLCYNCYEKMYDSMYGHYAMPNPFENEPDFELENDTATIDAVGEISYLKLHSGQLVHFQMPKQMVFNPDCRVKDYEKLVAFLLEQYTIYDNAKGFDKVRYMFKEVE